MRESAARHPRNNPEDKRRDQLQRLYGITPEQYNEMVKAQGGVCAVCKRSGHTKRPLHVDHCHDTGKVRALLCSSCNTALGLLGEDLERIKTLAVYLGEHA